MATAPADEVDAVVPLRDGWRYQSFERMQFQVPEDWNSGSPDQWCIDGGTKAPRVLEPGMAQTLALCTDPFQTYGVRVIDAAEVTPDLVDPDRRAAQAMGEYGEGVPGRAYPVGAEVRVAEAAGWALVIVAADVETADGIADSVRTSDSDPLGCAARSRPPSSTDTGSAIEDLDADAPITLCHYDGVGGLRGSERFDDADARSLVAALKATEVDPEAAGDCSAPGVHPWILVQAGPDRVWASLEGNGCLGVGIVAESNARRFTEDALFWLMSPGVSHQWGTSRLAPVPSQLRE